MFTTIFGFFSVLLGSWLGWLGLGTATLGLGAGLLWIAGLMPVVAAFLAPLARAVMEGIVWLWQNVFWPGLKDILDDWVTIVTVATMGAILYFTIMAHAELKVLKIEQELSHCRVQIERVAPEHEKSPSTWYNPFSW